MSLIGPLLGSGQDLNPAHDGCSCHCHRMAGVYHCIPCCGPSRNRGNLLFKQTPPNPPARGSIDHFEELLATAKKE